MNQPFAFKLIRGIINISIFSMFLLSYIYHWNTLIWISLGYYWLISIFGILLLVNSHFIHDDNKEDLKKQVPLMSINDIIFNGASLGLLYHLDYYFLSAFFFLGMLGVTRMGVMIYEEIPNKKEDNT